MPSIFMRGGKQLRGRVEVSGAKNAALPILAAALMASSGVTQLESVPRLMDLSLIHI